MSADPAIPTDNDQGAAVMVACRGGLRPGRAGRRNPIDEADQQTAALGRPSAVARRQAFVALPGAGTGGPGGEEAR